MESIKEAYVKMGRKCNDYTVQNGQIMIEHTREIRLNLEKGMEENNADIRREAEEDL